MNQWEKNAEDVSLLYSSYVDWKQRFYTCPWCDVPIFEREWTDEQLENRFCPFCEDD